MKHLFAAFALISLLIPVRALAQPSTVAFGARVTSANGVDAAQFSAGDSISISYSLNTNVGDNNSDPQAGVFFGASQSLSVTFGTKGILAVGTSGNVQTFDNFVSGLAGETSDQVFVFGGAMSSSTPLGGAPIDSVEVDFLSANVPPPDLPTMLLDDAIPTFLPAFNDAFVILTTSNGTTFVHFEVAGPTVQVTANGSHGRVELAPGDPLTIAAQVDSPGTGLANATVAIGVVAPFGTLWLGPSGFTTTPTARYSGPLPDFGPSTLFPIASTAAFPSGSYTWFMIVHDTATGAVGVGFVQTIVP